MSQAKWDVRFRLSAARHKLSLLKLIVSSHHQQRRISELECSLQHYSWKKILLERSFCKILQYSIQILEFFIYFERCKKGWRAVLTRNLSLKHFNESNKQLKVKTHFHDLKYEASDGTFWSTSQNVECNDLSIAVAQLTVTEPGHRTRLRHLHLIWNLLNWR